ncbi:MAG: peptide chain release factor 2 [Eubacteriales bacterium]|nr:peptide chain release factor 2 [Clostridium sp.]MDY5000847.1 peptide chain release factor 2 [Eubacteriales bacterium]MCI6817332.1 peptide chain release factor 2 [Clostridium sp.]MCI6987872.1 peptide chain release factor 2 [Clostridium sp.]MCI7012563.1 peptide chain release factor 2 [Clostridium sp.]
MVLLDEYRQQLTATIAALKQAGESLDLVGLADEKEKLESQMAEEGFWNDVDNANKVNQRIKVIHSKLDKYKKLEGKGEDVEVMFEMAEEEDDEELANEARQELAEFVKLVEEFRIATLLNGPYDSANAVLSLHAGAGGTEAQDWVSMLYRMYVRYCERAGYTVKELDLLEGDEAGIKSVTFECDGENAYGYLKAEKGVHRLVRISPFDSSGRRHTSFASLDVTPILDDDSSAIEINPDDIRVDTYRSSGAGGQHVNKTSSAIRITHFPTGVVVQCQNERSQIQNRETAMRMLRGKLLEIKERERMEHMADIKGEMKKIEWGSQIRSYVFQPYTMVKDHRTGEETGNIQAVMDGEIDNFINAFLMKS